MIFNDNRFKIRIDALELKQDKLFSDLEKKPDKLEKDAYERLADLEVKMAKLWALLVETNTYGKEKLTKFGRKFGGAAMRNNQ